MCCFAAYQQYYNGTRTHLALAKDFTADEVCPGDRQHSAAADPRRIAPSLRPDLISDTDTFVAKIERGERRIDVIEFIAIARAIGRDPMRLLKQYLEQERPSKPRSGPGIRSVHHWIIFLNIGYLSLTAGAARLFCCRAGAKPNVPKTKLQIGEGRRLTATWLNVMAAGIISAGTIPVLTALALERLGLSRSSLAAAPVFRLRSRSGIALGRTAHRPRKDVRLARTTCSYVSIVRRDGSPGDLGSVRDPVRFPTENDIDAVLEEFGNDPRAAIRALLCDLEAFAADRETIVRKAPSVRRRSKLTVRC